MQRMHVWLTVFFRHFLRRQQPFVSFLGPANARGARSDYDTDAVRTNARLEVDDALKETILLQTKPSQLVVSALKVLEAFGQRNLFQSFNATYPGIEITALEIITPEPCPLGDD
jgi:hypothetical protein